jgi:predicted permease
MGKTGGRDRQNPGGVVTFMSLLRGLVIGLRSLFQRRQVDKELDEELHSFLEMATDEKIKQGMNRNEALRTVRLERGSIGIAKEIVWAAKWEFLVQTCWQDLRFAVRTLHKSPGFTVVAVLMLAVGIGANSAIFSVIEAVSLRPLPYKNPEYLVLLADTQDAASGAFRFQDIESFRSQNHSFEDIAAYYRDSGFSRVVLTSGGEPEFIQGAFVSANFFPLMGVGPTVGRVFTPEEEAHHEPVLVLSYRVWMNRFGGTQDAIGKTIQIDGAPFQVIGVMPATFEFPARDQQFWAPLTTNRYWDDPALTANTDANHTRYFYERWQAIGRLNPGATLTQAQTEANTIFRRSELGPNENRAPGITLTPLRVSLSRNTRLGLRVLFCAVTLVLLISCSNVATLMLARGAARAREMAMRSALGAGRGRLTRQLLTESAVLGLSGGSVGLVVAYSGVRLLTAFAPSEIPRLEQAGIDSGTIFFTLTISLLSSVIFGLAPAWKASRNDPADSMRTGIPSGGPHLSRIRSVLVISEFAVAVVLLVGAGLLIRSFLALQSVDLGFEPAQVLTMNISLPSATTEARNAFDEAVLKRVRALAGVHAAGEVDALFELGGVGNLGLRAIDGRVPEAKDHWTPLSWSSIRGEYFQAMGATLSKGRYFTAQDGPTSQLVAIIDESMARRYWPEKMRWASGSKGRTQGATTTIGSQWWVWSAICAEVDPRTPRRHMSLSHTDKSSTEVRVARWSSELLEIRKWLQRHSEKRFGNLIIQPFFLTFPRWKSSSQISFRRAASKPHFLVCFLGLRWSSLA